MHSQSRWEFPKIAQYEALELNTGLRILLGKVWISFPPEAVESGRRQLVELYELDAASGALAGATVGGLGIALAKIRRSARLNVMRRKSRRS